ncbi:MAG: formyltransferase family protein [Geminicoccaceae bacterium]
MNTTLLLLTPFEGSELADLKAIFEDDAHIQIIRTSEELRATDIDQDTTLLSVGSGVIVPRDILERLEKPAYNLHAAPPELPGRDPHHHAVYRGHETYGATLHIMTEKVDAGAIVGVELFEVEKSDTPATLLARANEAGMVLLRRFASRLLDATPLQALGTVSWGQVKTTRADLIRLAEISPLIDEEEFDRRYHAFDGSAHDNLALRLQGRTFRIDKKRPLPPRDQASFSAFTEAAFRRLLQQLEAGGYRFSAFPSDAKDKHVLWRHDVDMSMHRAVRLARIEAEEGALATYFVNPRSTFYNLAEPEIQKLACEIAALGHEIGLHFDAGAFGKRHWRFDDLTNVLAAERGLVEMILGRPVRAVSWHNPDQSNLLEHDDDEIAGLVNAYGRKIRKNYVYCSDSNGYWRHADMADVIAGCSPRLHLLTHPVWWTPEPLSPSQRIDRAILGRARNVRRDYDGLLRRAGRVNFTGSAS